MSDFPQDAENQRSSAQVRRHEAETEEPPVPRSDPSTDAPGVDRKDDYTRPHREASDQSSPSPLFPAGESDEFRSKWMEIQTRFVDEPRQSVEEADALVKDVSDRLVSVFARNRDELERQWSEGDDVSTEDLRQMLRRYRSFFERLLSV